MPLPKNTYLPYPTRQESSSIHQWVRRFPSQVVSC
jgi:hypothetical protein